MLPGNRGLQGVASKAPRASGSTGGPTYVVAYPDPDCADPLQITAGLLEQVIHQLVQATLDRHLGSGRGVLFQGLDEGRGTLSTLPPAASVAFPPGREVGERPRGTKAGLRATFNARLDMVGRADRLNHWL